MICRQSSGRERVDEGRADAKMFSQTPPAQLRRRQSLAHLAIEEKKKRGPRAGSKSRFLSRPKPKNNNITKVVQVDTAV